MWGLVTDWLCSPYWSIPPTLKALECINHNLSWLLWMQHKHINLKKNRVGLPLPPMQYPKLFLTIPLDSSVLIWTNSDARLLGYSLILYYWKIENFRGHHHKEGMYFCQNCSKWFNPSTFTSIGIDLKKFWCFVHKIFTKFWFLEKLCFRRGGYPAKGITIFVNVVSKYLFP